MSERPMRLTEAQLAELWTLYDDNEQNLLAAKLVQRTELLLSTALRPADANKET